MFLRRTWERNPSPGPREADQEKVAMRRDAKSLRPPFGMKNGDGQGALAGGSGSSSSGGGGSGRSRGPVTEYAASQRILVLGDGDFSFARGAYALQPGPEPHRADRAASPATPPPRAALNGPRPRPAGLVRHCGSGANITATSFDSLKQVRRPLRAARRAARLRRAAPSSREPEPWPRPGRTPPGPRQVPTGKGEPRRPRQGAPHAPAPAAAPPRSALSAERARATGGCRRAARRGRDPPW